MAAIGVHMWQQPSSAGERFCHMWHQQSSAGERIRHMFTTMWSRRPPMLWKTLPGSRQPTGQLTTQRWQTWLVIHNLNPASIPLYLLYHSSQPW